MDAKFNLDEQLDYAIIEHGAIEHLKEYESRKQLKSHRIRHVMRMSSYAAAACVVLVACVGLKEIRDSRRVGYGVDLSGDGAKGASLIVALMNEGNNKEAIRKIDEMRPVDIATDGWGLYESQELDFLKAICFMRQGRFLSARKALKVIVEQEGYFSDKAEDLLRQL